MIKDMTPDEYLQVIADGKLNENCPVQKALSLFNGKWRTYILFELCKKSALRFGELKKAVPGITNTMLTSTLRDLEDIGIVKREQFNEIPPHVEYSLAESGKQLLPIFFEIAKWGETNIPNE